jgi:hypothetical protein
MMNVSPSNLIRAASSTKVFSRWEDLMLTLSKKLPDLNSKYLKFDKIEENIPEWIEYFNSTVIELQRFKLFINKYQKEPINIPLNLKVVKNWLKDIKIAIGVSETLVESVKDISWIPSKEAGEETTPQMNNLKLELDIIKSSLYSLFISINKERRRLEIESRIFSKPVEKPKIEGRGKKVAVKLNDWSMKFLKSLIGNEEEKKVIVNDQSQIEFDASSFKPKRKQSLLKEDDNWEIISYTAIVNASISKLNKKKLQESPYQFEVEYIGGTNHHALGFSSLYEPGFWYWREALLLGVSRKIESWEKLMNWINTIKNQDSDYKLVFSKVVPYTQPVYKKGKYYWLLIPKDTIDLKIYNWDLA